MRQGDESHSSGAAHIGGANGGGAANRASRETLLQIVVTWLSGSMLLVAAGYLIWEGVSEPTAATFSASVESVREAQGQFYLALRVSNDGGQSVQALGVSLELRDGERVVDEATATVDWLPEGSTRQVVLIFEADPSAYEINIGFEGYQVP